MRKLVIAAVTLTVLQVPGANATTFDWKYVGPTPFIYGSGTLQATYSGVGDAYDVTAISGVANGQTVLGLSDYDGPDQVVFSPSPPDVALDTLGISFSVGSGTTSFNIYEDDGLYTPGAPYGCGGVYCLLGPGDTGAGDPFVTVSFYLTPVAATPLPATLPLFATGLGAMGLLGWRRKKKAAALTA